MHSAEKCDATKSCKITEKLIALSRKKPRETEIKRMKDRTKDKMVP